MTFILIAQEQTDDAVYSTNTDAEVATACEALRDAGLEYGYEWVGEGVDSYKTGNKLFAAAAE